MVRRRSVAVAALAAAAVGVATLAWVSRERALALLERIPELGAAGYALCLGVYLVLAALGLPASWFTAVAAFGYGIPAGFALATLGTNAGANAAFFLARRWFRPRVAAWIARKPRMASLARAVGEDGFRITLLARLSPLSPFGITTYALSVMPLRQGAFALGTILGKTPGNFFYALLGAGARSAVEAASGDARQGPLEWTFLALGIVATALLALFLGRFAVAALRSAGVEERAPPT